MRKDSRNPSRDALLRSRELRGTRSISEKVMWEAVRKRRLGFLFKTQVPIGPYHLDFYCAEASLCIEVDGEQHASRSEHDARRDQFLRSKGIETLRIPSLDLFDKTADAYSAWLRVIVETCEARSGRRVFLHPQPPPHSAD